MEVLRPANRTSNISTAICGLFALVGPFGIVLAKPLVFRGAGLVDSVLFTFLMVRSYRSGLIFEHDILIARMDRRTLKVPLADIQRFDYGGWRRGLGVWLTDGQWIHVQNSGVFDSGSAGSAVEKLNQELALRKGR